MSYARIIDALNAKMPAGMNLDDDFYRALYGDSGAVPAVDPEVSSDYRTGALANEYEALRSFIDSVARNIDIDTYEGETLDTVVEFFTGIISRFYAEEDATLGYRFRSVMQRGLNTSWSTVHAMKAVLDYYYDTENLYVVENAIETDLVVNGSFEDALGAEWTLTTTGAATLATDGDIVFDGGASLKFTADSGETCSAAQTFSSLAAGAYDLRFVARPGSDHVSAGGTFGWKAQRASDSYYFDASDLSWKAADTLNEVSLTDSDEWLLAHGWVITDATETVTVTFVESGASTVSAYIDRVEFGVRSGYPYGQVWIVSQGQSGEFMGLWESGADPVGGGADYENADYLDQAYIGGIATGTTERVFTDLVDSIRPAGTKWDVIGIGRDVVEV